eukprot:4444500-Pyramimonas_sp.AAC.1
MGAGHFRWSVLLSEQYVRGRRLLFSPPSSSSFPPPRAPSAWRSLAPSDRGVGNAPSGIGGQDPTCPEAC